MTLDIVALATEAVNKKISIAGDGADRFLKRSGITLSKDALATFKNLFRFKMLELNLLTNIEIHVAFMPKKSKALVGETASCRCCGLDRPVSLFGSAMTCGLCHLIMATQCSITHAIWPSLEPTDVIHWVECSISTCRARYPIYDAAGLNVKPKCYYCRNDIGCPSVTCKQCKSKVVVRNALRKQLIERGGYTCQLCKYGYQSQKQKISVVDLIKENGLGWLGIPKHMAFTGRSLHHYVAAYGIEAFGPKQGLFRTDCLLYNTLYIGGRPITTPTAAVMARVWQWVENGITEMDTCSICFGEFAKFQLFPACGRHGCREMADLECLRRHYGINQPGQIITTGALTCAFCRRRPTPKIVSRYSFKLLRGIEQLEADKELWFSAWCQGCNTASRVLERACGAEPPQLTDFQCHICRPPPEEVQLEAAAAIERRKKNRLKECPKCKTMVEKVMGCNHITCTVCAAHWCWKCDFLSPHIGKPGSEDVYKHMELTHGSYYDFNIMEQEHEEQADQERDDLEREYRHIWLRRVYHEQAQQMGMMDIDQDVGVGVDPNVDPGAGPLQPPPPPFVFRLPNVRRPQA
ncbi:hypothetical protein BDZ91DRAFT_77927 [Kalaharituber pfeilii]|nr:hypothetical protein BDZ91DRAFT_77927 [Kalaharituber pfeilii]